MRRSSRTSNGASLEAGSVLFGPQWNAVRRPLGHHDVHLRGRTRNREVAVWIVGVLLLALLRHLLKVCSRQIQFTARDGEKERKCRRAIRGVILSSRGVVLLQVLAVCET